MSKKVYIGASSVDLYFNGLKYGETEEAICKKMLTPYAPSEAAIRGTAMHQLVESHRNPGFWYGHGVNRYFYSTETKRKLPTPKVQLVLDYCDEFLGDLVKETWLPRLPLKYMGWEVLITGKIDGYGMKTGFIHDHKFRDSEAWGDYVDDYIDSTQWVLYCIMAGVPRFQYNIFHRLERSPEPNSKPVEFYAPAGPPIKLYLFPNALDYLMKNQLGEFLDFLHRHNMLERIREFKLKQYAQRVNKRT